MHYRFQIQPEGRAGLSEKCLTQRLWIQVFSSISNWASKTIKNLLHKLKARGYQLLFKDLQPLKSWSTGWQLSSPACRYLRCVMVTSAVGRSKAEERKRWGRQKQEDRRRATCRNKVWRGTWCGCVGCSTLPWPIPGDAPEDTDTRKSTCGHAECERRWTSLVTERCRRWAGISVLSLTPGAAAQSWFIVWSSFQSQGPILWDWDWDRIRWTLQTNPGPLRSCLALYSPRWSKVGGNFIHLRRSNAIASISIILPLFRCILLTWKLLDTRKSPL